MGSMIGGGCFVAGTQILVPSFDTGSDSYTTVSIENIKEGDLVMSFDADLRLSPRVVTKVWHHLQPRRVGSVQAWDGTEISGTWEHLVYSHTHKGFLELCKVPSLTTYMGVVKPVIEFIPINEYMPTYNLTVEGLHTYIANGFLVHNLGGGGGGKEIESTYSPMSEALMPFIEAAVPQYLSMYKNYYWPNEKLLAGNELRWTKEALDEDQAIQDYQIQRAMETLGVAEETNPMLDDSRKDLIRRLVEGEDVLADRMRGQAASDQAASFGAQRSQLQDKMSQMGINPNSGAWASSLGTLANNEALSTAGALTKATWDAEDKSLERMTQAQSLYTNPARLLGTQDPSMTAKDFFSAGASTSRPVSQQVSGGSSMGGLGSILGIGTSLLGSYLGAK